MSGNPSEGSVRVTTEQPPMAAGVDGLDIWSPPEIWTKRWRDLVLDIVDPARRADDATLALFFYRAQKLELDPLNRQIFILWIGGKPLFYVGIQAMRLLAQRTGERAGEKVLAEERGTDGQLLSITVAVGRMRTVATMVTEAAFVAKAKMSEYAPKDPPEGSSWKTRPEFMLEKCAAAAAYRKAFPEVLGDVYTREELEREAD